MTPAQCSHAAMQLAAYPSQQLQHANLVQAARTIDHLGARIHRAHPMRSRLV